MCAAIYHWEVCAGTMGVMNLSVGSIYNLIQGMGTTKVERFGGLGPTVT